MNDGHPVGNERLLLSFYGDDNTGSTDSMEALARHGVETVLFLAPPEKSALARFPGVQAVGVAGMTRTMNPEAMEAELGPAFTRLAALGARVCHYKVCSTFDSSPTVGSIGRGIEVGARILDTSVVPLLVGAPVLRRYTLFGNLFATVGQETHRIDRHPTMSRHPVTPMDEGDLRRHLGKQTKRRIALMDILALTGRADELDARFDALRAEQPGVLLFDVLDDARLVEAGRLIWRMSSEKPVFVCGSSGVEYALAPVFRAEGHIPATPPSFAPIAPVEQLLVVSGSCSPITQAQLDFVLDQVPEGQRFAGLDVNAAALLDPDQAGAARQDAIRRAIDIIEGGASVVLYSARGPEDERIKRAEAEWKRRNPAAGGPGTAIGQHLGHIVRAVLEAVNRNGRRLRRVLIAGGDTSGHGARGLGVEALKMLAPTAPGSPLCRAYSRDPLIDGLEIVLKGGQVGKAGYFESVRSGRFD